MGTDAQNPTPTPVPATTASPFDAVPGHQIEDTSTMSASKDNSQTMHRLAPGQKPNANYDPLGGLTEKANAFTEPIENYTQAGRAEHPILSRLGDVTRGVKELLEGGQAAGKPMGTSHGVGELAPLADTGGANELAEHAAGAENFVRETAPKAVAHVAETGRNFLTSLMEEGKAALEATHPEGSAEAGFADIPGYSKEAPAPKKEVPHVQPPSEEEAATKKAEADLAAARASYGKDMEKNPTTFPKGTPVHEQVVNVDPNKVIAKVNPGGQTFDEPTVQRYQQEIREGKDIPAARIEYGKSGDVRGYDGRHRAEAARREGTQLKLWTRREVEPGEAPPTEFGPSEENAYELNGDENDIPEAAKPRPPQQPPPTEPPAGAAEAAPEEDEGAYHPDLQAVADKYGVTDQPYKIGNGASFITPDGQFIHGGSTTHEKMIGDLDKGGFVNRTGAIRTRVSNDRAGHTLHVTVPVDGVKPDQVDALKAGAREALGSGKSGNIVMETADGAKSATHEFANANNIEPMLREIGAHPDKETPADTTPWNEKAAKLHEQNGGFTINPRTGAVPESGHVVEAVPEARQVSDKPNTPEQIQKFADKNKKLLAKNPELHIGGYTNDAGKHELNLSAVTNDPTKAEKVAKALDQESYYNVAEGKTVPTGGKNVQQAFPDYTVAQRLRDLAPEEPGMTISTRQPSSVKYSTEDPMRHNLRLTDDLINKNPALADKWAAEVRNYPGFNAPEGADTRATLNAFIEHAKDNLKHLYNSLSPEEQEKNKVWYDGAHKLTKEMSEQHGYSHPQMAGVVASLSPQKDWDQNVSLARRLTDIVKNQQDTIATPDMVKKSKEIIEASRTKKNPNANKELGILAKQIQGKKLSELTGRGEKAAFVRLYDEIHNPREYFKINADGSNAGVYKKLDGSNGQVAWGSQNEINKAINILADGSRDSLSNNLGQAHKVRHFYNNIIEPNSARGDVTIDTHAVGAALMRAVSGKTPEVLTNFGGPGSNIHGLNGTYPLYHEAYVRAAKELDIDMPRKLQSVVWEHIRNLFPAEFKTPENMAAIDGIWKEKQNGQITADEARNKITQYAREHGAGNDEGTRHGPDAGELPPHGVLGEPTGGPGGRDRGGNSVGDKAERPSKPAESSEKESTGGWLKLLQSSTKK